MVQIGYYPGQPIPRPFRGKPIPPNEYRFDEINQWIKQLQIEVAGLPDTIQEQVLNDFKRQLNVSASPRKNAYDTQLALQHGDLDEAPGVQLQVNINPLDWVEDPVKQFNKTLEGWKNSLTNQTDIQNWIERRYYWEPVLAGRDELAPSEGEQRVPALFEPIENAAKRIITEKVTKEAVLGKNPFHLTDVGVEGFAPWLGRRSSSQSYPETDKVTGEVSDVMKTAIRGSQDKYADVAAKFLVFTENVEGASKRNSSYNNLRFSASDAVVTEFQNRFGLRKEGKNPDFSNPSSFNPSVLNSDVDIELDDTFIKGLRIGTNPGDLTQEQAYEFANIYAAHKVADSMRFFGSGPTGEGGVNGLIGDLSAIALQGNRAFDSTTKAHLDLSEVLTGARKSLVDDERKRLDKIESWVNSLQTNNANGLTEDQVKSIVSAFKKDQTIKKYRDRIDRIDNLLGNAINSASGITDQGSAAAKDLIRQITPQLKETRDQIAGTGFFRKGIYNEHLNKINDTLVRGKPIYAGKDVNGLVEAGKSFAEQHGLRTGVDNVKNVLDVGQRNYDRNDVGDVLRNVQGGKLLQAYVMPEIRKYIPYTERVERFMKESHYLGLVYDKGQMERNVAMMDKSAWVQNASTGKWEVQTIQDKLWKYDPVKKVWVPNKDGYVDFTLGGEYMANYDRFAKYMPKNNFVLRGFDGRKFTVTGGNHFEAAETFYKEFVRIGELKDHTDVANQFVKVTLSKQGRFDFFKGNTPAERLESASYFIRVLNGEKLDQFSVANALKDPKELDRFYGQVGLFRAWLEKHKDHLGLSFTNGKIDLNEKNAESLQNLFKQLGERIRSNDYISITWDRAGVLQHMSSFANRFQTKVLKKIAPLLAPFLQLKNAIVNTISLGLTKAAQVLLGTGTGGLSVLVGRFIEPVVRFVVNTVVNKVQDFLTAFVKGDVSKFIKDMDKLIMNSVKIALYIMAVPFLIILAMGFMFFGSTLTTISQVDWTRTATSGTVLPPGVGNYVGCLNEAYNSSSLSGGSFSDSQLESCFIFADASSGNPGGYNMVNWPDADRQMFMEALRRINAATGTYFDQLCANGPVRMYRSSDQPGWCGHVFGTEIVFLSTCSYTGLDYVAYLLAHETGHVFDNYVGGLNDFTSETINVEGTLPTYDLNCGSNNSVSEDFAETIGNLVHVNCGSCSGIAQTLGTNYDEFWSRFPAHYNWIRNRFGL